MEMQSVPNANIDFLHCVRKELKIKMICLHYLNQISWVQGMNYDAYRH